jgi:putative endonuclease
VIEHAEFHSGFLQLRGVSQTSQPSSPGLSRRSRLGGHKLSAVIAGLVPAIPIRETRTVKQYYVYILASRPGRAIYVGVTSNLIKRVYEHKNGLVQGHTKRYGINKLVYFEVCDTAYNAIQREKNIKHWPRVWKTRLIAQQNPTWRDLYEEICS